MINSEVFLTLTNEYKLLQNLLPTSFKLYKILTQGWKIKQHKYD